jgi:hypothetical protein
VLELLVACCKNRIADLFYNSLYLNSAGLFSKSIK